MIASVTQLGNQLLVTNTDDSTVLLYPTGRGTWIPGASESGGGSGAPSGSEPVPASGATLYNPWSHYEISGTWAEHLSYSAGGVDYPLPYGTNLKAPAAGTLHTTGGTGEFRTGMVGSAGRRSILVLDTPFTRTQPIETGEASGAMVAIVFQHQSAFGTDNQHYAIGAVCGVSGASANGDDYGGDVHLHVHGLTASGGRVNLLNFMP